MSVNAHAVRFLKMLLLKKKKNRSTLYKNYAVFKVKSGPVF